MAAVASAPSWAQRRLLELDCPVVAARGLGLATHTSCISLEKGPCQLCPQREMKVRPCSWSLLCPALGARLGSGGGHGHQLITFSWVDSPGFMLFFRGKHVGLEQSFSRESAWGLA